MAKSRKDINKDALYNMLMPSGAFDHTVAPNIKFVKPYDPYADERDEKAAELEAEKEQQSSGEESAEEKTESEKEDNSAVEEQEEIELTEEEKELNEYVEKLNSREKGSGPLEEADKVISGIPSADNSDPKKNNIQTIMVNIREKMVMEKLDEALEKFNCCTCFFCRQDVTCMALNSLKPKYIVTTEEDIDKIIGSEDSSEVTQAIMKAILHVKTHPRH